MAEYDLAIVGGGMVGSSLALLCARANPHWRIALIDPQPAQAGQVPERPSFDARATALSAGTAAYLDKLAVWQDLEAAAAPIRRVHISDKGYLPGQKIDAAELAVKALGYVVPNQHLGLALSSALAQRTGIEAVTDKVSQLTFVPDSAQISLEGGAGISAKLVAIADGADSPLCKVLGIGQRQRHYQQRAVIANVRVSKAHNNIAYERFTDEGPLALLPLAATHEMALVWTQPTLAPDRTRLPETVFLQQLQQRFGHRLGRFEAVSERFSYPLQLRQVDEQWRSRLVIVGNAAHSLHPVAGQGFNLSLRDCAVLADCVQGVADPGAAQVLSAYSQKRQQDQLLTTELSHAMVKLFSSRNPVLVSARHIGLLGLELFAPLKGAFTQQMMGGQSGAA
ncbi:2-octaprenyl-6-methoxyphenyl hydroxylase [Gilvimarinus sp. DA14]|uniref:2-octaprenyl-6-methoxyphenyl hydroxylase n=1 Tax=Gilvimarinus sp. DA14 TaxID=2956798 RepID=UPI0020B76861|nr:2-octaprenyl-6-methoxyphenyl hydroxylase [Gilvimarinus sp. DA14]UTF59241.1 2-octaprenyl-6-methoxyphenyl hydroxylase [Gilvimarinus sp. DA14]